MSTSETILINEETDISALIDEHWGILPNIRIEKESRI